MEGQDDAKNKKTDEPEEEKPKGRHYVLEIQDAVHGANIKKDTGR